MRLALRCHRLLVNLSQHCACHAVSRPHRSDEQQQRKQPEHEKAG